MLIISFDYV